MEAQRAEAEQKTADAQAELDKEQANEQTEKKKITEEKKQQQEDISQIRATHGQRHRPVDVPRHGNSGTLRRAHEAGLRRGLGNSRRA